MAWSAVLSGRNEWDSACAIIGFYLGFIVWGRSSEGPNATNFLGGLEACPPEIFEMNMRWDVIWYIFTHNFEKCYSCVHWPRRVRGTNFKEGQRLYPTFPFPKAFLNWNLRISISRTGPWRPHCRSFSGGCRSITQQYVGGVQVCMRGWKEKR